MNAADLYQQIADSLRRQILEGELQPGDRLPPMREQAVRWNCTPGTVQRAYQELARLGLVVSRPGQGTCVTGNRPVESDTSLQRAALVHRAEAFLLEMLTAGHPLPSIQQALDLAMDRWRALQQTSEQSAPKTLQFVGSHDIAVNWLQAHFGDISPGATLNVRFGGSLAGLIALAEGRADLAGAHLWDPETDTYNVPFIRKLLPGQRVALVRLASRRLGWAVALGNPRGFKSFADLLRPDIRFINRQPGSGTRVWLDAQLHQYGIAAEAIQGYADTQPTHTAVARAIAEGKADVGLALEASAALYGLAFSPLTEECYDLIIPTAAYNRPEISDLLTWLRPEALSTALSSLRGYNFAQCGQVQWVEAA